MTSSIEKWYNSYIEAFARVTAASIASFDTKFTLRTLKEFIETHDAKLAFIAYNTYLKESTGEGALSRHNLYDGQWIINPTPIYDHFNGDTNYMCSHIDEYWQYVLEHLFEKIDAYQFKDVHQQYPRLSKVIIDYVIKCASIVYQRHLAYTMKNRKERLLKIIKENLNRVQLVFDRFANYNSSVKLNIYDYFTHNEIHQKLIEIHQIDFNIEKYITCLEKFLGSFEFNAMHPYLLYLMYKVYKHVPNATKEQFDVIRKFEDMNAYERPTVFNEKYNKTIELSLSHNKYTYKRINNMIYVEWKTYHDLQWITIPFIISQKRIYIKWNYDKQYFIDYLSKERSECLREDDNDNVYVSYNAYLYFNSLFSTIDIDNVNHPNPHYEIMIQIAKNILSRNEY